MYSWRVSCMRWTSTISHLMQVFFVQNVLGKLDRHLRPHYLKLKELTTNQPLARTLRPLSSVKISSSHSATLCYQPFSILVGYPFSHIAYNQPVKVIEAYHSANQTGTSLAQWEDQSLPFNHSIGPMVQLHTDALRLDPISLDR
jgi:hypothetical protein